MSILAFKTFSVGEVLTAADLNSSFSNIINNAADLISPLTKAVSMGGFGFYLDSGSTIGLQATTGGANLIGGDLNILSGKLNMTAGAINEVHGADIASASTINLDTATGNLVDVTGTTTITAITLSNGRERTTRFTGALTLTNGASLVLQGGADITTVAGDTAIWRGYSGGVVRLIGGSVLTTRLSANLASTSTTLGAALIGWIRAATGAVAYTLGVWLGWQKPNVLEFMTTAQRVDVLANTGALDVTAAVQAAVTASVAAGRVLNWTAGAFLITGTISIPTGTQMQGEHKNAGGPGFLNGTKILFQPASDQSLFVPSGGPSLYRVGYYIDGFYIIGNSSNSSGHSLFAIDVDGINKSLFSNLTITNFRTPIRCNATIDNRFEFNQIVNFYIAGILYAGGIATTDVWDQTYIANGPIGILAQATSGGTVGIKWIHTVFESLTNYCLQLYMESDGWAFYDTYAEDCPAGNAATDCVFRVGVDGSATPVSLNLTVKGGRFVGRQAGISGSLFYIDTIDGVVLGDFHAYSYTNGILTTANTQTKQILSTGFTAQSVTNIVTDSTKIIGLYPQGSMNGGTRNNQAAQFASLLLNGSATIQSGAAAGSGSDLVLGNATQTTVGAAGGASAIPGSPTGYLLFYKGSTKYAIPYYASA